MKNKSIVTIALSLIVVLIAAATPSVGEQNNPFSLGYGILTSTGTDAKRPSPGALTAKYGFGMDKAFKPYIGAGLGYSPSSLENKAGGSALDMRTGVAYQLGFNYMIGENSSINLDYKQLSLPTEIKQGGNESSPSLLGIGLNIKF